MIKLAIVLVIVSVIAGLLGFSRVSVGAAAVAKNLFFIALAIFLTIVVFGLILGVALF